MTERQENIKVSSNIGGDYAQDEIDLSELVSKIWSRKILIALIASCCVGLVLTFHLFSRVVSVPNSIELPIMFTFSGVTTGKYPNGDKFLISDVVDNDNLISAMEDINNSGLIEAVSIQPGNGLIKTVEDSIIQNLQGKDLTEQQILQLNEFRIRVNNYARRYAVLSVDISKTTASPDQITRYLEEILTKWSNRSIYENGVLNVKSQVVNNPFKINPSASLIKEVFRFQSYLAALNASYADLSRYGVVNLNAFSSQNGRKLSGVKVDLNSVTTEFSDMLSMIPSVIRQSSAKDQQVSKAMLAAKRFNLGYEKTMLQSKVEMYDQSLAMLDSRVSDNGVVNKRTTAGNQVPIYGAEMSEQMFNSLLLLGKTVSDADIRAQIINKRIEKAEEIEEINLLFAKLSQVSAVKILNKESLQGLFNQQIDEANRLHFDLKNIAGQVSVQIVGSSASLWEPLAPVQVLSNTPTTLKKMQLQLVLALILGLMLGAFLALVLPARKSELHPV